MTDAAEIARGLADDAPCTDCDDTGWTYQTERPCSCDAGLAVRAELERIGDE